MGSETVSVTGSPTTRVLSEVPGWPLRNPLLGDPLRDPLRELSEPLRPAVGGSFFYLQLELFCLQLSFFACSPLASCGGAGGMVEPRAFATCANCAAPIPS